MGSCQEKKKREKLLKTHSHLGRKYNHTTMFLGLVFLRFSFFLFVMQLWTVLGKKQHLMKVDPLCCSASALSTGLLLFRVTPDQYSQKGKEEHGPGEHTTCTTLLLASPARLALRNTALRHVRLSGEGRSWRDSRERKNRRQKEELEARNT